MIKIAQTTMARDSNAMKEAFAQFNELNKNSGILGKDECPDALYSAENAFARFGFYMGGTPIPEVVNFDNVRLGGTAAAAPQDDSIGSIVLYEYPSDAAALGES